MKYRKKPVAIEAVQWTGENQKEIFDFVDTGMQFMDDSLLNSTIEGVMIAIKGDYFIKGLNGEFYSFKPDIFHKTYDAV